MPHARLTHPTRPDLEWRQGQRDEDSREAVANVAPELGVDRPPLVHVETRERTRSVRGRVTGPRRAENDGTTSDWRQALANYVDLLEAHCDEFQGFGGDGYTFVDDIRSTSFNVVYTGLEWTLTAGRPYEVEYDVDLSIGRGVMEARSIDRRNPTVDTGMSVAAKVGGEDLPGMRELRVARSFEFDTKAIYDKTSAENNEVVPTEGVRQTITFRGTHTGSDSARASADAALDALQDGTQYTFETAFPGYDLDGFVIGYDSNLQASFGTSRTDYVLQFIEGERA